MAQIPLSSRDSYGGLIPKQALGERDGDPRNVQGNGQFPADAEIWYSLKCAISTSSGFKSWRLEHYPQLQGLHLEKQVRRYLRETLETLAY
jgi:hypothetical protein